MTLGNWFSPFSRRRVFAAAMTSLKTISRAVSCDSAPLVRTVRWRTVANTLPNRVDRAQVVPVLGREVVKRQQRLAVLGQVRGGLRVFGPVLLGEGGDRRPRGRAI